MNFDIGAGAIIQGVVVGALVYMAKLLITATVSISALQEWTDSHDKHHSGLEKRVERVEDRLAG